MNHAYEFLRYGDSESGDQHEIKRSKKISKCNEKSNDELTSTASFLSRLSDLTPTDEYYIEQSNGIVGSRQLSKKFDDTIFAEVHSNGNEKDVSKSDESCKTIIVVGNLVKKRNKISDESSDDIQCENNRRAQSQPKRVKRYLNASKDFIREKLSIPIGRRRSIDDVLPTTEANLNPHVNPIYERIDTSIISLDCDKNVNFNWEKNAIAAKNVSLYDQSNPKPSMINPSGCVHTFAHRTVSRSISCFVCSKK